jgi:hypothetical protein
MALESESGPGSTSKLDEVGVRRESRRRRRKRRVTRAMRRRPRSMDTTAAIMAVLLLDEEEPVDELALPVAIAVVLRNDEVLGRLIAHE